MNLIKNNDKEDLIPLKFHLSQNYPNPFKEKTKIKYCLAYKTDVRVTIFNSSHEIVEELFIKDQTAGTYEIEFTIKSRTDFVKHSFTFYEKEKKSNLPKGIYFYQLKAGDYSNTKSMVVL